MRLLADRSLPAQIALGSAGVSIAVAALAWLLADVGGASASEIGVAVLIGGMAAGAAATLLAQRASRGLGEIVDASLLLRRDDAPRDANVPLLDTSADLRRATLNLQRLVDAFRERLQELVARNAVLGQRLEVRTHELTTLQDLSIGLASKADLYELIDEALHALEQTIDYSSASVWGRETDPARADVTLLGYRAGALADGNPVPDDLRGMRLSRANLHTYERIERERAPIIENHARQSLLSWLWSLVVDDTRTAALYKTTRSWMALPLNFREHVMGVLRVDHDEQDYFDDARARLLTAVGSQAALAMRHAELAVQEREVAILAERNRIARDLHDAVSQTLFASNVLAGTLARLAGETPADPATIREQAAALERLNRGALAEMRLLMFELRPDALERATLAELLNHATEALRSRGDLAIEQSIDETDALVPHVRLQLYRIAQEALSNVMRHSGATRATVEWTVDAAGRAHLRIADNGAGFDPDAPRPGHFGLDNMRSRAAEAGATFAVTSVPGQGTEVRVDLDQSRT